LSHIDFAFIYATGKIKIFVTRVIRIAGRVNLLQLAVRELWNFKIMAVGVRVIRRDKSGTHLGDDFAFLCGK